jgi:BirA family biotin operon repressor/biotin-[acetyl-CoA-carboxylase] ligase
LSASAISSATGAPWPVETVVETGSTNQDLLQRARERAPLAPLVRAANEQSAGRGRAGRTWHAPRGAALLFSVAIPLGAGQALHAASALAAGVAIAELLRSEGVDAELKWPNDLLLDGAKLGGILAEVAIDPQHAVTIVIGVGLNIWTDAASRAAIGTPVAELTSRLAPERFVAERERWLGRLAAAAVARDGFAPWRPRFEALFAYRGQSIELREGAQLIASGIALGVDDHGQLRVRSARGVEAHVSGDVSLRLADSQR